MFYCDKCADRNAWPITIFAKSYGKCEICEKTAECNDRPSRLLPMPRKRNGNEVKPYDGPKAA